MASIDYMHGVHKSEEGWARFRARTDQGKHARRKDMTRSSLPAQIRVRGRVRRRAQV